MEDYKVDLVLEDIDEKDNRFIFTAKSITKDFVCEPGLERLANDSPGKHLVWRHEHPLIPEFNSTHIYGRVLESHVSDGGIISKYEVYNHTPEHLKVREVIRKRFELNNPIKISMRFRQYGEEKPIHFDVVEHSLTPTPACKECKAIEILNEDDKMDKDIEKMVKELEDELTKKDKKLEVLEKKLEDLESEYTEAKKKVSLKEKELENQKGEKEKILDEVLSFKDKLNEQNKIIDQLKEDLKMKELEPLLKNLAELDGKEMTEIYQMKAKSCLLEEKAFEETKEFFKGRIKQLESRNIMATPESLDETASKAIQESKLEETPEQKKARDNAFRHMPPEFFKRGE